MLLQLAVGPSAAAAASRVAKWSFARGLRRIDAPVWEPLRRDCRLWKRIPASHGFSQHATAANTEHSSVVANGVVANGVEADGAIINNCDINLVLRDTLPPRRRVWHARLAAGGFFWIDLPSSIASHAASPVVL